MSPIVAVVLFALLSFLAAATSSDRGSKPTRDVTSSQNAPDRTLGDSMALGA